MKTYSDQANFVPFIIRTLVLFVLSLAGAAGVLLLLAIGVAVLLSGCERRGGLRRSVLTNESRSRSTPYTLAAAAMTCPHTATQSVRVCAGESVGAHVFRAFGRHAVVRLAARRRDRSCCCCCLLLLLLLLLLLATEHHSHRANTQQQCAGAHAQVAQVYCNTIHGARPELTNFDSCDSTLASKRQTRTGVYCNTIK
jgi:hypothetical protein